MKFRFRQIPPLIKAEIELGDLTIIAGRNNTGKTYLAYALYGLLKQCRVWPVEVHDDEEISHPDWRMEAAPDSGPPNWASLASAVARDGRAVLRVTPKALAAHCRHVRNLFGQDFVRDQLPAVFRVRHPEAYDEAEVQVLEDRPAFPEACSLEFAPGSKLIVRYENETLEFSARRRDGSALGRHPWLREALLRTYSQLLLAQLPRPFVLTGERLGIALFYRELDFAKNKLVEMLQNLDRRSGRDDPDKPFLVIEKAASRYALPIKDNITYTRSLPDRNGSSGELGGERLLSGLGKLVDGEFTASDGEIRYRSRKGDSPSFDIPIHRASSSARALMEFDFFVRHDARKGQLLIVDEPESHLDVDNQVALARLVARITAAGVRVLVTTHSDYFVKEINNLIMAAGLEPSNPLQNELGYDEGTRVPASSVRAYMAEAGMLQPCEVDRYGIEMPLFEKAVREIDYRSRALATELYEEGRDE